MKTTWIAMLSVVVLGAISAPLWAGGPVRYGLYDQADFTPPDFADGQSAIVTAGESRTFNFKCRCADQPRTVNCYGNIFLQVNSGSGYSEVASAACGIPELGWCPVTYVHTFDSGGDYAFRIVCDENNGTDYIQGAAEVVHVTVTAAGCTNGATRPCPLQGGVCAGSVETCTGGVWGGCSYGLDYEEPEWTCDDLDNDCDATIDNVDHDGDGFVACSGVPDVVNELLLTSTDGIGGSIQILEYRDGAYQEAWQTVSPDVQYNTSGGGEAGDLTGDGVPEIVLVRSNSDGIWTEVWSTTTGDDWSVIWTSPSVYGGYYVGDIMDFDGDGMNEFLLTNEYTEELELYGYDGMGIVREARVRDCSAYNAYFLAAGGDMDGDELPEIAFQCYAPDTLHIHEYRAGSIPDESYPTIAEVVLPGNPVSNPMIVDDMERGDVNGDGHDDIVFCGNSGQGHVLTYTGSGYDIEDVSPPPANPYSFSQTCSAGDITGDGVADLLVVNREGAKVISHDGNDYYEAWGVAIPSNMPPGIGTSFVGDADNDGLGEFLFIDFTTRAVRLYEGDSYTNSFVFGPTVNGLGTIIVGNLNPSNDVLPVDCEDADPTQGAFEICGDGVTNDCDAQVDEGCPSEYCGNSYCAGASMGETCQSCPADCGCYGPSCRFGCCGDYVCGRNENTTNCPVDCH